MKKRIPALVSLGFGLLLVLGLTTSSFLLLELFSEVKGAGAIDQAGFNLRSPVRSLCATYLEMGQEVSTTLIDPSLDEEAGERRLRAKANADKVLNQILAATRSEPLRQNCSP